MERVKTLDVSNRGLSELKKLPFGVETLICSNNFLKSLPKLPSTLKCLICDNNELSVLPEHLPDKLEVLECSNNLLGCIPALPSGLKCFKCSGNSITTLPDIPDSLQVLDCRDNLIQYLPVFRKVLSYFNCEKNPIKPFPVLVDRVNVIRELSRQNQSSIQIRKFASIFEERGKNGDTEPGILSDSVKKLFIDPQTNWELYQKQIAYVLVLIEITRRVLALQRLYRKYRASRVAASVHPAAGLTVFGCLVLRDILKKRRERLERHQQRLKETSESESERESQGHSLTQSLRN
jgi:Leucine-rich repeat (LRR) protein